MRDQHIKNAIAQGQHEGRQQIDNSGIMLQTGNSFLSQQQPALFLASTKKGPGLQKECAGSYVNVINNRTCLGQKNVFKFSMDLPLRLKQQMWVHHQLQEKDPFLQHLQTYSCRQLTSITKPQNKDLQEDANTLQIVGTSSQVHLFNQEQAVHFQQQTGASSSSNRLLHHVVPTHNLDNSHPQFLEGGPQTAELSKLDLIPQQSPYKDHSDRYAEEATHDQIGQSSEEDLMKAAPTTGKRSKIIYSINKSTSKQELIASKKKRFTTVSSSVKRKNTANNIDSAGQSSLGGLHLAARGPYQDVVQEQSQVVEMPVIRSQNSSFHKARKQTKKNESMSVQQHEIPNDFNITQISIKVDSRRAQTVEGNLQTTDFMIAKGGNNIFENRSVISQTSSRGGAGTLFRKQKVNRGAEVKNNESMKIHRLNLHNRRASDSSNTQYNASLIKYTSARNKQMEIRTTQLKARCKSAVQKANNQATMTLIGPYIHNLTIIPQNDTALLSTPEIQSQDQQPQQIRIIEESKDVVKGQEDVSNTPEISNTSYFEATQVQLMKVPSLNEGAYFELKQPNNELKKRSSKNVISKLQGRSLNDNHTESPSFPRIQTQEHISSRHNLEPPKNFERPSTENKGSRTNIEVSHRDICQPLNLDNQSETIGNKGKGSVQQNSTISIHEEDVGFFHKNQEDQASTLHQALQSDLGTESRRVSNLEVNAKKQESFLLASSIMDKVVVKSPGKQMTDHLIQPNAALLPFQNIERQGDILDVDRSPKRTVLIRKSRGGSLEDSLEIVIEKPKETVVQQPQPSSKYKVTSLTPMQIITLDQLKQQDFLSLQREEEVRAANQEVINLPRHGTAAPSVQRRNKDTIKRKKGVQPSQSQQRQGFDSTYQTFTQGFPNQQKRNDIMSATFHIMPSSRNSNVQQKSKTPNNQKVYQHTSKMQALVIHQSELAIDANQQRTQMRLIQAYQDHQIKQNSHMESYLNQDLQGDMQAKPSVLLNVHPKTKKTVIQPSLGVLCSDIPLITHQFIDSLDDSSSFKKHDTANSNDLSGKLQGWRDSKEGIVQLSVENSIGDNMLIRESMDVTNKRPFGYGGRRDKSRRKKAQKVDKAKTVQPGINESMKEGSLSVVGKHVKAQL